MHFALIFNDHEGKLDVRMDTREAHLKWLGEHHEAGRVLFAGPFLGRGDKPTGSLLIIDVPGMEQAETFAAEDPYAKAGLFASTEIRPWRLVFGPAD